MKNLLIAGLMALTLTVCVTQKVNADPTFVGSFLVNGGGSAPSWTVNPLCYTGQEAAALLFGGLPSDYFISIDSSLDPTTITHTAHLDGWAESDTIFAEDFDLQTGTGYNDPGGKGSAWSAYVQDHSDNSVNYVWLANLDAPVDNGPPVDDRGPSPTPEPASLALLGTGSLSMLGMLKRRMLG